MTDTIPLRITRLKFLPEIERGYKRSYKKCSVCGRVTFRDYVPYALSRPILVYPCGHPPEYQHAVEEQEALRLILAAREARVARASRDLLSMPIGTHHAA